jgi:uncharacterized membrane protein (UPF0127 family)
MTVSAKGQGRGQPPPSTKVTVMRIDVQKTTLGSILQLTFAIDRTELRMSPTQMGMRVQLDNWAHAREVNGPALPQKAFSVALPVGMAVATAEVKVLGQELVAPGPVVVAPCKPLREDRPSKAFVRHLAVLPDYKLYKWMLHNPRPPARFLKTYMLNELPIACVEFNPVQVTPEQSLVLVTHIVVLLYLQQAAAPDLLRAFSEAQQARTAAMAKAVVVNPHEVPVAPPPTPLPKGTIDYLIITDNHTWNAAVIKPNGQASGDLVTTFRRLMDWRTQHGLNARVVTITDIVNNTSGYGNFVTGAKDLQEVIRRFLQWAHSAWGVAYVLLGGGQSIVPVRSISTVSWISTTAPTDFYYSGLDLKNNWSENQAIVYGQCDFTIHLSVGRVAVTSADQADRFVSKVIAYEKLPMTDGPPGTASYQSRLLLAATPWNWDIRTDVTQAACTPPGDNQFYHASGTSYALLKLIEVLHLTIVHPADPHENPGPNHYTHVPGEDHCKLQIPDCYNEIRSIVVKSRNGFTHALNYYNDPGPTKYGWRFDNGTTTFIIVYDDLSQLEPAEYTIYLKAEFREPQNLLRVDASGDIHDIPYAVDAAAKSFGWYYAKSETDLNPSAPSSTFPGQQTATPWIVAYDSAANFSATTLVKYMWDPTEKEGSMMNTEMLRKQIQTEIPRWDAVSRLYMDEVDLPPEDRKTPAIEHFNKQRFVAAMNQGPHIVELSGHGCPTYCCNVIDTTLADNLTNGANQSIIHHNGCLTNRFTWEGGSLSSHFVLNPKNGAVAYIGLTDESDVPIGSYFQNQIFHALASSGRLGPAMDSIALLLQQPSTASDAFRRIIILYSLAGDPGMTVHWAVPDYIIATQLFVSQNANGGIELAYVRTDGKIYHIRQTDPNGNWARARVLDGWAKQVVLAPNADQRLEVIYIGTDNKLYHAWQTTPNGSWTQSYVLDNGSHAKQLAVAINADGRLEVIYIGSDNKLYHIWQATPNGAWTDSYVLDNGSYAKQLGLGRNADGRLEVIYIGSDNKLYHIWQATPNGAWTDSYVLDNGSYAKQLGLGRNADGRLEVFYIGSDDKVYHIWQATPNGGWTPSYVLNG